ncbi:MAG: zinc ribbon domain-containing protein [Candidatus Lokiarchaeota archaeon]|nr:zinc ribbon domain-containing protein [Candidatus Lokiarchaeota archaeon]
MWNNSILEAFRDFGKNMQLVAIFLLVSMIPGIGVIAMILVLVFKFAALNNIKYINLTLNSDLLEKYRSKMISSITRLFIAIFSVIPGGIFLAIGFFIPIENIVITIIIGAFLLALALILVISAFVIEMKAWKELKIFFEENQNKFSRILFRDVIKGTDNLATGALLYALFFVGITVFVGFILQIVGYFQVARMADMMREIPQESEIIMMNNTPNVASTSTIILKQAESTNFCPMCGSRVSQQGNFCAECGSKF